MLQVYKDPRETEERRAPVDLKAPLVPQVKQDKLEMMDHLDLQERQVLQLR